MSDKPVQDYDKFVLRLPDGMRDRLKEIAAENGRSLNAEIVARLQITLHDEQVTVEGEKRFLRSVSQLEAMTEMMRDMIQTVFVEKNADGSELKGLSPDGIMDLVAKKADERTGKPD